MEYYGGMVFRNLLSLIWTASCSLTAVGCVCVDGVHVFNTDVRVVYEDGLPVPNARVVGKDGSSPTDENPTTLWDLGYVLTDADGLATLQIFSTQAWGGCGLDHDAPIPDPPKRLTLYVEYPHGRVFTIKISVTDDMITARRSGELDIDVGEVIIPPFIPPSDSPQNDTDGGSTDEVDAGQISPSGNAYSTSGAESPSHNSSPSHSSHDRPSRNTDD